MKALFCEPLGNGCPPRDAQRKRRDAKQLKVMNGLCKEPLTEVLPLLDEKNLRAALHYEPVYEYVMRNGTENGDIDWSQCL